MSGRRSTSARLGCSTRSTAGGRSEGPNAADRSVKIVRVRLAVLIPAYNPGPALGQTLASLAADSLPFDIVIVDDGSWPAIDVPDHVSGHRVVLLRHARNLGVAAALNTGLAHVLGGAYEYVARIDAGDLNEPPRLARQTLYLDERPDVALVGAWTRHLDPDGRFLFMTRYPARWEDILRRFHYRTAFSHPASMIRTGALRAAGVYDERFTLGEDYELFWRVARRFRCENIPEVLVTCVETAQSLMHRRRTAAARIRLRVQWQQFAWTRVDCWLGLARSLALFAVPAQTLDTLKKAAGIIG
jgi:cellulose synthase/poly-beta-1,6-N-acetylglucosamine synthase-like glycosyltransferase